MWAAFFEDLKVLLLQPRDKCAVGIRDADGKKDEAAVYRDFGLVDFGLESGGSGIFARERLGRDESAAENENEREP